MLAVCCLLFAGCASNSPAVGAIMKHDVNGLKKILDSGVSPNFVEDHEGVYGSGSSLLAISVGSGDNDTSRLLLDRGADLAKSKALYQATIYANNQYGELPDFKSPISLFLEKGVDSNQKLDNGMSIIHAACSDPKSMRVLISKGANINDLYIAPYNEYSQTPLGACLNGAVAENQKISEIRMTISSPFGGVSNPAIQKNLRNGIDWHTKLLNRNIDSALILLNSGANPNVMLLVNGGMTSPVLSWAVGTGSLRGVGAMLDHGADPMAMSKPGKKTALHFAAELGYVEIAELLINAGADASVKDDNGYTAQIYLDQKLQADRASKLLIQRATDEIRREQSEAANASGFQLGKFAALAAGAAIGRVDKLSSDVQVKLFTGMIQDSMAGHDGMGNTQAAINDAKASMGNGGNGGKSAGDPSNAADRKAKAKACANEYDGPNDDPQTDTYCKLAAYDACLHRAGITEGDQSGRASCHTLNELLEATGSKYTCRYCPYPF